ncbi:glycosyltransferase family 4 protein [Mycolicibacterium iranicum]|uniref:Glycosyltransferase family 4 protein n=1 Tax=Mycolicibacterium iranicum TaxID=912594 RepID=A0ABT4HLQ2_MYCIR|nr:glycosyltransferase family 4 protein [Mycolicibacterium iranicum]MCZ0731014.1 glycosyltransferase family 4 protein [Mycolicibacterium iranicum]
MSDPSRLPDCSSRAQASVRSVLLLCWRDTGHPQGGGSETYLQRIGAQLAASGTRVTLRTARYPGAARREIVDGVEIQRRGGPYSVYIRAGLAMVAARIGLGPMRHVRPDVVVDTQNGLPFLSRLAYGRRTVVLVHHCHREQWPVAGPVMSRIGWFVESWLSPRAHRRNQYVTVSLPSARDLTLLGVHPDHVAVVRNGVDAAPESSLAFPRSATPRVVVLSRLVPHKQIEDALDAIAQLRTRVPDLHLDVLGGGWWSQKLVDHAARLGITDAVTFHGHVDHDTKHAVLQRSWVHVLPSRKEGWGLAVVEAAQHGVPTIGYRSSGGLTDSIVDGVTGMLVDGLPELVDGLERLLTDDMLREQLGVKAQLRSGEFSWEQSAEAMRAVLETVRAGHLTSGVLDRPTRALRQG